MAEDTTLRDELAKDRTVLANERTLLAYGRTSVGLVALAVFVFRFSPTPVGIAVGVSSLVAAAALIFWGWRNYRIVSNRIAGQGVHNSLDIDA